MRSDDPYHQRDHFLTVDAALDRFRTCLQECNGDPNDAAVMLYTKDRHASEVLDRAYSLEEATLLAQSYTETADGNGDAELLDIKTYTN